MTLKDNLTRALGLGSRAPRAAAGLYARAMEIARQPQWYAAGGVPDTLDGRFEMVALVIALLIARLQALGMAQTEADLADCYAGDMDAALRESGVGDLSISKQVGYAIGALGGRIGAYRAALVGGDGALGEALTKNLYAGHAPDAALLGWSEREVRALAGRFAALDARAIEAAQL